jgi:hypothetical protein
MSQHARPMATHVRARGGWVTWLNAHAAHRRTQTHTDAHAHTRTHTLALTHKHTPRHAPHTNVNRGGSGLAEVQVLQTEA